MVANINSGHRTSEEVRWMLAELTGKPVDESVTVFPPFYSEFGQNLTFGKDVFVNIGCRIQTPAASRSETAPLSATAAP
jgi:acetyltransferase-like isoleucine patch superfamily enzyme